MEGIFKKITVLLWMIWFLLVIVISNAKSDYLEVKGNQRCPTLLLGSGNYRFSSFIPISAGTNAHLFQPLGFPIIELLGKERCCEITRFPLALCD